MSKYKYNICKYRDCNVHASYGYINGSIDYCSTHKKDNMVIRIGYMCIQVGCYKYASYNYMGETKRLYCRAHRRMNMVNVSDKYCIYEGCTVIARYNYKGVRPPIYCKHHKVLNMVYVRTKPTCKFENCEEEACYGYENSTKRLYCKLHKKDEMIDRKRREKYCGVDGCTVYATYGYEGVKRQKRLCNKHKEEGMVNLHSKNRTWNTECHYRPVLHIEGVPIKCSNKPEYNYEGSKVAKYCREHKDDNMILLRMKYGCSASDCTKRPIWMDSGGIRYCAIHKKSTDMMRIPKYNCKALNCTEAASYGSINHKTPKFCKSHKLEDMIEIQAKSRKRKREE